MNKVRFSLNGDGMVNVHPHTDTVICDSLNGIWIFEMSETDFNDYIGGYGLYVDCDMIMDDNDGTIYGDIEYWREIHG